MMNYNFKQSGNVGLLRLVGQLTSSHKEDLMSILMTSLSNSEHIIMNIEEVTEIDFSCLKLFCIAAGTSIKMQKTITLAGLHEKTPEYKNINKCCNHSFNCAFSMDKKCMLMQVCWYVPA